MGEIVDPLPFSAFTLNSLTPHFLAKWSSVFVKYFAIAPFASHNPTSESPHIRMIPGLKQVLANLLMLSIPVNTDLKKKARLCVSTLLL